MHTCTRNTSPSWTDVGSLSLSPAVSESANVSGAQVGRVEETAAAGGSLPGLRLHHNSNQAVLSHLMASADSADPDDDFFDMLVKCQVAHTASFRKKTRETAGLTVQSLTRLLPLGLPFGRPALCSSPSAGTRAHRTR